MERGDHHQVPKQQQEKNNINNTITTTTNDRLKRDEWSEGAVSSLLESYEAKWTLRNRAKLKGQDWEDVARPVSGRVGGSKSAKTQTQCKNKIESMKKRYRSETAAAADATSSSSWPLYHRLDLLLRGNSTTGVINNPSSAMMVVPPPQPAGLGLGSAFDQQNSNAIGERVPKAQGDDGTTNGAELISLKNGDQSEKMNLIDAEDDDADSSTAPAIYAEIKDTKVPLKKSKCENEDHNKSINNNNKRSRKGYWDEIGESIRWVAELVVRSEQARMETIKEIEKMRAEADVKRGEIELKRTQIIVDTQLKIAKLFANANANANGERSLP
ncbi:hypothetical protein CASFOL_034042 [Castilleja foliolosa]|uniref:Myb/SANT-like DNA-binding domain-containing protein n=1 Tax=Castilleja foliolosa TaxID=1961234 RepID=A0ABD3C0D7_9LAMI